MALFSSRADMQLANLPSYIDRITDRLTSFQSTMTSHDDGFNFAFPWGGAQLRMPAGQLQLEAQAETADGLARIKDILATAVELYAMQDNPTVVWLGDLSGTKLVQFRLATAIEVSNVTPNMRCIRFRADDLARFANFGGMHIRLLLPSAEVPEPVWPEQGPNGLPVWPDEKQRPVTRVYTIRDIDVAQGTFDVDMLAHGTESPGSAWAINAQPGMKVGVMGPLGRPVPEADWYLMGADETGIPAMARLLARLPETTSGLAFVEVADDSERQELPTRTGIEVQWIYRNGIPAGEDTRLAEAVRSVTWPTDRPTFGWFAAEASAAKDVRLHWRETLGMGRQQTLAAAYWRIGASGIMTG